MVEALKIPDEDRTYRLREYAPGDFWIPSGKSDRSIMRGGVPASEVGLGVEVRV